MPDSSLRVILYSFLLLSFRICLPLKNDGRGELRFREVVNDFSPKKKSIQNASCPRLSGSKRTTFRRVKRHWKSEWVEKERILIVSCLRLWGTAFLLCQFSVFCFTHTDLPSFYILWYYHVLIFKTIFYHNKTDLFKLVSWSNFLGSVYYKIWIWCFYFLFYLL